MYGLPILPRVSVAPISARRFPETFFEGFGQVVFIAKAGSRSGYFEAFAFQDHRPGRIQSQFHETVRGRIARFDAIPVAQG